jgi:hypothetical protein
MLVNVGIEGNGEIDGGDMGNVFIVLFAPIGLFSVMVLHNGVLHFLLI